MTKAKVFLKEQKTLVILVLFCVFTSIFIPGFLTGSNLINVLVQVSIYGITACGMTFAIISGEFDLSVGSTMALTGLLCWNPKSGRRAQSFLRWERPPSSGW